MHTSQFQDEPTSVMTSHGRVFDRDAMNTHDESAEIVAGLVLALGIRDWLTDLERDQLDGLLPGRAVVFLTRARTYLHPEEVELFPLHVIETAISHGGEAVFTHRYEPTETRGRRYRIHTAVLNPEREEPHILGVLGPDTEPTVESLEERFIRLVDCFRRSRRELEPTLDRVREALVSRSPALVIDRSTGRIAAANLAATQILGIGERELTGREFSTMGASMDRALTGRKLVSANLEAGGMHVSLVTMPAVVSATETDPFVTDFFVHRLRHKIANVTVAASLLNTMREAGANAEELTLIQSILDETSELDRHLTKLNLALDYDNMPRTWSNLVSDVEHAADLVRADTGTEIPVRIENNAADPNATAPQKAFVTLFEAILRGHQTGRCETTQTSVVFEDSEDERGALVRFETTLGDRDQTAEIDRYWNDYAVRLAGRMDVELRSDAKARDGVIRTEAVVPCGLDILEGV